MILLAREFYQKTNKHNTSIITHLERSLNNNVRWQLITYSIQTVAYLIIIVSSLKHYTVFQIKIKQQKQIT